METFYTLDQFYDFIYNKLGAEYSDRLKELVSEQVAKETEKLKENIDIYSCGFNQALHHIDGYESLTKVKLDGFDDSNIIEAERLDKKIYKWINQPDYFAEV